MKYKIIAAALLLLLGLAGQASAISAEACVVIDAATGDTLYEQNPDLALPIASITKIMTAVVVLENSNLSDVVTVQPEDTAVEGSSMYLKTGDRITVRDLLTGLMLSSGNDAALALARHTFGRVPEFVKEMNRVAAELGMTNTSFANPHGLDAESHYSTAADMARLTAEAMKAPVFADMASMMSAQVTAGSFTNHNRLLFQLDGALGVKTGYTSGAGRTLVSCAERAGSRFICVTLHAPDDWTDHETLYSQCFAKYRTEAVISADIEYELPVLSGTAETVTVHVGEDVLRTLPADAKTELQVSLPRFVYAPVIAGEKAGEVRALLNGECIAETELIFAETVELHPKARLTFWEKVKRAFYLGSIYGNYGEIY